MTEAEQATMETSRRGRPWAEACCGGCLVLVVLAIVAWFVFSHWASSPVEKRTTLPADFPSSVRLPGQAHAANIVYVSGKNSGGVVKQALGPVAWFSQLLGEPMSPSTTSAITQSASAQSSVEMLLPVVASSTAAEEEQLTENLVLQGFDVTAGYDTTTASDILEADSSDTTVIIHATTVAPFIIVNVRYATPN